MGFKQIPVPQVPNNSFLDPKSKCNNVKIEVKMAISPEHANMFTGNGVQLTKNRPKLPEMGPKLPKISCFVLNDVSSTGRVATMCYAYLLLKKRQSTSTLQA